MKKLKIVILSTLWERTPPALYGGTERVVSYITEELVKRGHDVTLFATGDSKTRAKLKAVYPRALYRDNIPWSSHHDHLIMVGKAIEYATEIGADIIHSNVSSYAIPFSYISPVPIVHTLHGAIDPKVVSSGKVRLMNAFHKANFVSISNNERALKNVHYVATVYNGIPINDYRFNKKGGDTLVWLGRFTPFKGAAEAIAVAKKTGRKLIMAGKIDRGVKEDVEYFNRLVKPHLKKGKVEYVGEVGLKGKNELFGNARVNLNLVNWREPFGLVPVEANACGTPALVTRMGAMPELVIPGVNGYVVSVGDVDRAAKFVEKIYAMPDDEYEAFRATTRARVEDTFTIEKMVDGYEHAYEKVIHSHKRK